MEDTIERAAKAAVVVFAHLLIAAVLIPAIAAVDRQIRFLNGG